MYFFTPGINLPYETNPIGLFSGQHLLVTILILIGLTFYTKTYKESRNKVSLRRQLALIILFLEVAKHTILLVTNQFQWSFLPLHLCSIGILVILTDAFYENKFSKEILFMLTFPGAIAALVTPDWVSQPLFNFFSLHSFTIHALLVLYVLVRFTAKEIKPRLKNVWIPITFLGFALPIIWQVNVRLNTNFFF